MLEDVTLLSDCMLKIWALVFKSKYDRHTSQERYIMSIVDFLYGVKQIQEILLRC